MHKQLEAETESAPKGVYVQTMHKSLVLNQPIMPMKHIENHHSKLQV